PWLVRLRVAYPTHYGGAIVLTAITAGALGILAYLDSWRARFPDAGTRGLQVQARRSRLTPRGPVAIAPLVLAHYREDPDGSER
ncbi:MAG: hypothetical protein HOP15_08270, partial [Planctomycetes bacterium]|nr:hypothetical protein [Planctomycetota bacterium]